MKAILAVLLISLLTAGCSVMRSQPVIEARAVQPAIDFPLANRAFPAWAEVVKETNRQVSGSLAGKLHSRVRVVFPSGGWVDFEPCPVAVAADRLPPLKEIRFAPAAAGADSRSILAVRAPEAA